MSAQNSKRKAPSRSPPDQQLRHRAVSRPEAKRPKVIHSPQTETTPRVAGQVYAAEIELVVAEPLEEKIECQEVPPEPQLSEILDQILSQVKENVKEIKLLKGTFVERNREIENLRVQLVLLRQEKSEKEAIQALPELIPVADPPPKLDPEAPHVDSNGRPRIHPSRQMDVDRASSPKVNGVPQKVQKPRPKLGDSTPNLKILGKQVREQFRLKNLGPGKMPVISKNQGLRIFSEWERIVLGDHGAYFEVKEKSVNRKVCSQGKLSRQGYFRCDRTLDGVRIYTQRKSVSDKMNPPPGPFAVGMDREGGLYLHKRDFCSSYWGKWIANP